LLRGIVGTVVPPVLIFYAHVTMFASIEYPGRVFVQGK